MKNKIKRFRSKVIPVTELKDGQGCLIEKWGRRPDWIGFDMIRRGNAFVSITPKYRKKKWGWSHDFLNDKFYDDYNKLGDYMVRVFPQGRSDSMVKVAAKRLRKIGAANTYLPE